MNALRAHDKAMVSMAKDLWDNDSIPSPLRAFVVFATPNKAISYYITNIGQMVDKKSNKKIKYPIVTITRVGYPEIDMTRFMSCSERMLRRYEYPERDRQTQELIEPAKSVVTKVHLFVPVKLTYQVDILLESSEAGMNIMNDMLERLLVEFDIGMINYIPIDYGSIYGQYRVMVSLDGIADNSELEPDPSSERIIRSSITFGMEAWIPRGYEDVKTVLDVDVEEEII